MRRTTLLIPAVAASVLLAGCSWGIKLSDSGRQVRTDWTGQMAGCQRLGKVTVSVADHLGPIDRNSVKVRDELEVLARNEAASMDGANTVHPLAQPKDGSQPWGVYQCGAAPANSPSATPAASTSSGTQTFPIENH